MKHFLLLTVICLMPTTITLAAPPTGASILWTSEDPILSKARALILDGQLTQAESVLTESSNPAAAEGLDVIRRIRHDYSLTPAAIQEKLAKSVRDLTADDVARWTKAGQLQHRTIDGQTRYFRREPSNLFRFCPEAIARRLTPPAKDAFALTDHLADVIRQARDSGKAEVAPVRHRVTFTVTVPANVKGAKPGSVVRAWLPFPQEYRQQSDVSLVSTTPTSASLSTSSPHRTLYFEQKVTDPAQPLKFTAKFDYASRAYYPALDDAKVQPLPADFPAAEFLAERPPHIRFSPQLKETVQQIVGDETNPLAKARKIFHWVDANIRYNAEEEYCIIPSFSEHGLTRKRGDCGIQATLFVTLCRAAGVPARWQSGWQTMPGGNNMHDWAEIYVAPWGWLPCDPSYGLKESSDPAVREFYFGHQDAYRMIVNLDYGRELDPAKRSLRSEPADFQRGEVEVDGRNLYFDEFDYDFSVVQD